MRFQRDLQLCLGVEPIDLVGILIASLDLALQISLFEFFREGLLHIFELLHGLHPIHLSR